jgi:hypothetical protein
VALLELILVAENTKLFKLKICLFAIKCKQACLRYAVNYCDISSHALSRKWKIPNFPRRNKMTNTNRSNIAFSMVEAPTFPDNPKMTSTMAIEALGKFFISPNLLSKQIAQEALEAHYRASVASA